MNESPLLDDPHDNADRAALAARLDEHLATAARLRTAARANPRLEAGRRHLRAWQASRLEQTYPDLLDSPRFGPAARFFLSDLYGPMDFCERDAEMGRILPMIERALPRSGLLALDHALELDALSEELDACMIDALATTSEAGTLNETAYKRAWKRVGRKNCRLRQIALVGATGQALDALVAKPMMTTALRLMRGPARLAGLEELHGFLDRGFSAFRHMEGADEFLTTINDRERAFVAALFA